MRALKIFYPLLILTMLSSCGLDRMAKKYDTVGFTTTPTTLETHGGEVALKLDGNFPKKYFCKKTTVDFTPVLVYEGGETAFKSITIQGENTSGGGKTIVNKTGGSFQYEDIIPYSQEMMNSTLELRAVAKRKDKEKVLGPVNIANGVIATSTRVQDNEDVANNNHGYEHETILEQRATIYFLVNQSNIRTTEKSDDDIKALKAFAKNGYKTHSISIISYASPEGSVNVNDDVSGNRMKSTVNYTKRLLRSLKVDGARNNDLYTQTSVGEDWEGFESLINASNIKDKQKINRIVNRIVDVNVREQQIRDLAEIYDAVEQDVLPQLRKATVIIRSYEPKRTDEEIAELSITNPEELTVNELLFAATLTEDEDTKWLIYQKVIELHNDWRGYNNIAALAIESFRASEDFILNTDTAMWCLNKAEEIGGPTNDILTNKGIIAACAGELTKAQQLFDKANTTEKNQAILDIRQGEYAKAARFYKGGRSHNAVLAQLLNGDNSVRCNEENTSAYYLNAIAACRGGNNDEAIMWLKKYDRTPYSNSKQMANDLEFVNLRPYESFIELTK